MMFVIGGWRRGLAFPTRKNRRGDEEGVIACELNLRHL
jgi:hypothetical protein